MAKRGFTGSWFDASQGPAKPHAHGKGKLVYRPGAEQARKAWLKRKLGDPKAWGLQPAKAASPPTFLAPCTKPTLDPVKGPWRNENLAVARPTGAELTSTEAMPMTLRYQLEGALRP